MAHEFCLQKSLVRAGTGLCQPANPHKLPRGPLSPRGLGDARGPSLTNHGTGGVGEPQTPPAAHLSVMSTPPHVYITHTVVGGGPPPTKDLAINCPLKVKLLGKINRKKKLPSPLGQSPQVSGCLQRLALASLVSRCGTTTESGLQASAQAVLLPSRKTSSFRPRLR